MDYPDDAVEFVADWWELSGNIVTTLAAFRHLKRLYSEEYLTAFCPSKEVADRAAALQEICRYFEALGRHASQTPSPLPPPRAK
jgi:hypothetical protein